MVSASVDILLVVLLPFLAVASYWAVGLERATQVVSRHNLVSLDFNGDGIGDRALCRPDYTRDGASRGAIGIFLSAPARFSQSLAKADILILGDAAGDRLGGSCANAGDVSGDGTDDLILAAAHNTPLGQEKAGAAYLSLGSNALRGVYTIAQVMAMGEAVAFWGDVAGYTVSGAPDRDGDGLRDLLVAAPTGSVYLILSSSDLLRTGGFLSPAMLLSREPAWNPSLQPARFSADLAGKSLPFGE